MKKFEEKAIPLIFRNQSKKYEVNPEAIRFFQSIEGKIAVISVAGVYRTGKSYLLNTILLKQKTGFAVGPTTNPKTKGIWVWGKPLILKNQKDEIINVCVLDSEGLGSIEQDVNHDLRLFSLTLLLSSMFIYNTIGSIDQHAIDSLGLVLRLCERLRAQSYNDFPDFYWVLRDFSLALVGKDNKPLTPNKYLQQSLSPQAGDSEVRNKIRQSIRSSFVNRACFTFVRPLTNQQQLQKLDTMEIDQLRPQFMEQVIEFRRLINSSIRTKRIKGKEVSPEMLVELIKVYTAEINGQELPQIQTGWKYVCTRECEQAMATVQKQAEQAISKLLTSIPSTKKELAEKKDQIYEFLKKTYDAKTAGNDQAAHFQPEINKLLDRLMVRVEDQMRLKNSQETKAFIKRQFQNVERRLKAGQFKGMGELAKEFEMFYEYYRKKCPYKDEIQTGLETILKKFSDCSLVLFKSVKNRKDQENAKLRQEVERLSQQLQSKEERNKHEKSLAADKLAILESKLQEISRQNKQLSNELSQSEMALEKLKNEHEEGAQIAKQTVEMELLVLRKKLMDAQEAIQEAECSKQFQINNFKNQVLLKQNQIKHITEERNQLSAKIGSLSQELRVEKEERGKRIEELISSSETSRNQWESIRKSFEERLSSREQQILRLESSLEAKAAELISLTQQNEKTLKALLERHQSEKAQLQDANKDELRSLRQALQAQEEGNVMKIKKLEGDYSQKEMELKMHRLAMDREMAIANQKLDFIRKECAQKQQKIAKLQEQNNCYLAMLEQKDNQLSNVNSILDQSRVTSDSYQSEIASKLQEMSLALKEKTKQLAKYQQIEEQLQSDLRQKVQETIQLNQQIRMQNKTNEDRIKELGQRLNWSQEQADKTKKALEEEIEALRQENTKGMEDQKKAAELSLVQLKNYYEMERERLEKKNLQQRKKHQSLQAILSADLQGKHRKAIRSLQEELQSMRLAKDQLEDQFTRAENDWEVKFNTFEEEREAERRELANRYEVLERRHDELQSEYQQLEHTYEEERINFVKKVQSLNFELSRKEKELMQLNSRKETLQQSIVKKETQLQSVKKLMNQEIEGALKKISDMQAKYQKLNEQYMQYKIASEKELALVKQKNEFQANKLNQLCKDKQIGSNKNLERLDKQRFGDLKDQNEKLKAQILALQSKLQIQRKTTREQEATAKKQYATLQRDFQFLQQKENISQAKISDLESRLNQKGDNFIKQVQQIRLKAASEREAAQKELEQLRQRLNSLEDQKNQVMWNYQKETALQNQKMAYMEYQRNQARKQLEQCEKRLGIATAQLRKISEKGAEDSEARKQQTDKKYTNQIQTLKDSLRNKTQQYEETIRKLKEELKSAKEKVLDQAEKLQAYERARSTERALMQENESLRRQKEALIHCHRSERQRQNEEWKRKNTELERKNKDLQKLRNDIWLQIEKDNSKWKMQKNNLLEKIKALEDTLESQRNKSQLIKSKTDLKKSQSSTNFNYTEYSKFSSGWK